MKQKWSLLNIFHVVKNVIHYNNKNRKNNKKETERKKEEDIYDEDDNTNTNINDTQSDKELEEFLDSVDD